MRVSVRLRVIRQTRENNPYLKNPMADFRYGLAENQAARDF